MHILIVTTFSSQVPGPPRGYANTGLDEADRLQREYDPVCYGLSSSREGGGGVLRDRKGKGITGQERTTRRADKM